jgi:hypothetical protein
MKHAWRRCAVIPILLAVGAVSCSSSGSTDPVVVGTTIAGLNFQLTGATLTVVNSALPAADPSFVAPLVTVNQTPTATVAATLNVSAAESFTTILVQPTGNASYVRIVLPTATQLISIRVLTDPTNSTSVAATANVAVSSGTRASLTSVAKFVAVAN